MTTEADSADLLRRGVNLERVTLDQNVVGIVVLAVAAQSVALAGFGLDSLVEIARAPSCCGSSRTAATPGSSGPCG